MATGAPPAIAVGGAAAEMTKNATPEVPNVACRSWCSCRAGSPVEALSLSVLSAFFVS
jgi:hypothetical protein